MPGVNEVHLDALLTNVSVGYKNLKYISDELFPEVPVTKQSDKYNIYDPTMDEFLVEGDIRAPGTDARVTDMALSRDQYYAKEHALAAPITDEERANQDVGVNLEMRKTKFLTGKILLGQEKQVVDQITASGALPGATLSGTGQWSHTSSDPQAAVDAQKTTIIKAVAQVPNTLALGYDVYEKVRRHPAVIEWYKRKIGMEADKFPGVEELQSYFDVPRVLVGTALRKTTAKGAAATNAFVWAGLALLCYVSPGGPQEEACLGAKFRWTLGPQTINGAGVRRWRVDSRKTDYIEVSRYEDHKIVASGAAFLWKSVIA